ncbi:MAG TPA: class F sortase [Candidatus Saccharimonadales bacterium]|nr:class F sortase [Candidatus Saccharimonadales bacterium]
MATTSPRNRETNAGQPHRWQPRITYYYHAWMTYIQRPFNSSQGSLHMRQGALAVLVAVALTGAVHFGMQVNTSGNITLTKPAAAAARASHPLEVKPAASSLALPRSVPTQLTIPSVGITTPLATVGRNPDGSVHVPDDEHMAGWYQGSPTPGEIGPSIIVGHLDGAYDTGVFWNLNKVQVGDTIQITRSDGQTHTFTVNDVEQVSRDNFPTNKVYGNISYAGLRLITCGGTFNTSTREYSLNTVVFATLTK